MVFEWSGAGRRGVRPGSLSSGWVGGADEAVVVVDVEAPGRRIEHEPPVVVFVEQVVVVPAHEDEVGQLRLAVVGCLPEADVVAFAGPGGRLAAGPAAGAVLDDQL